MKILAAILIVTVVTLSILSGRLPVWVQWAVGGLATCGLCVVLFVVPTIGAERRPADETGG